MPHEIHRLQSITDAKGRNVGSLQYTAKGWHAFNAAGAPVGSVRNPGKGREEEVGAA